MRHRPQLSPPSVALAVGVLVLLAAPAAHATYPGTSGPIAYNTTCQDPSSLTLIWPDGSRKTKAAVAGLEPAWSADGSRVAYVRTSKIYVAAADGSDEKLLVSGGGKPTWSPDTTHPRIAVYREFGSADHSIDRSEGQK